MPYDASADIGAGTDTVAAGAAAPVPYDAPADIGAGIDTSAAGTTVRMQ